MKLLTLLSLATALSLYQETWSVADSAIRRLPPAAFSHLDRNIVAHLQGEGCAVPQSYLKSEPHNVISGEFERRGQTDWAVLCSRNGQSSIIVFWRGSTRSVSEIGKAPDRTFLQMVSGDGKFAFSRSIESVGRDYIMSHYQAYRGRKPPRITHEGINDAYVEKASVVLYYHRGNWLKLQGAD